METVLLPLHWRILLSALQHNIYTYIELITMSTGLGIWHAGNDIRHRAKFRGDPSYRC